MAAGQFATSSFCGDNPGAVRPFGGANIFIERWIDHTSLSVNSTPGGPACIRVQGFCDPSQAWMNVSNFAEVMNVLVLDSCIGGCKPDPDI